MAPQRRLIRTVVAGQLPLQVGDMPFCAGRLVVAAVEAGVQKMITGWVPRGVP